MFFWIGNWIKSFTIWLVTTTVSFAVTNKRKFHFGLYHSYSTSKTALWIWYRTIKSGSYKMACLHQLLLIGICRAKKLELYMHNKYVVMEFSLLYNAENIVLFHIVLYTRIRIAACGMVQISSTVTTRTICTCNVINSVS